MAKREIRREMRLIKRQDKEKSDEARNYGRMSLIKKVHGLIENTDIEKHRHSQDQYGMAFGNSRAIHIREISLGDTRGNMPAEWVGVTRPHLEKNVILYCHGGGYTTGSRRYARPLTTRLAASASMDVFCFDYRLAPEHPYPAAGEDVLKAWDYLMFQGYGAREVIVAGDSAGGNLALSLLLRLKTQGRKLPRGLVLMSPWTDLTMSGESYETKADIDPVLSRDYIQRMIANYVGENEDLAAPLISPLFGDFSGFPPTCIQVGENEILLSDAVSLYENLRKAGVPAKIDIRKGMWHVYQMAPFRAAYDAIERNAVFINEICQ